MLQILCLKGFVTQIGQIAVCLVALQPLNLLHWNYMDATFKSSTFWLTVVMLQKKEKKSTSLMKYFPLCNNTCAYSSLQISGVPQNG